MTFAVFGLPLTFIGLAAAFTAAGLWRRESGWAPLWFISRAGIGALCLLAGGAALVAGGHYELSNLDVGVIAVFSTLRLAFVAYVAACLVLIGVGAVLRAIARPDGRHAITGKEVFAWSVVAALIVTVAELYTFQGVVKHGGQILYSPQQILYSPQEVLYSPQQIRTLVEKLRPVDVVGANKVRMGHDSDGGYVMIDEHDFERLYSYGVGRDISFEVDFVERWPVPAYLYDHTIDGIPRNDHPALLRWKKEGIAATRLPNLNSLSAHIAENGDTDRENLVLKMDVEGAEWYSILATEDEVLRQFRQIVMELHGLTSQRWNASYEVKAAVLDKMRRSFHLVHAHGNNHGTVYVDQEYLLPDVLEVTYLRRDPDIVVRSSQTEYPIGGLDYPNRVGAEDIRLDKRPFAPSTRGDTHNRR
jgi:hypothetical protein